jgi:hypothetical protein
MFMKSTINARLALSFGLLSLAGAGAAVAAQPAADAQEQARILLSGPSLSGGDFKPRAEARSSTAATSAALDTQLQAREMIVGRPAAGTPAATVPGDRTAAVDAHELAREMILGSQSRANPAKTRVAAKAG